MHRYKNENLGHITNISKIFVQMDGQSKIDRIRRVMVNVIKMFERRGYSMGDSGDIYKNIASKNESVEKLYNENTYFIIMTAMQNNGTQHMAFIVKESETLKKHITKEIDAIKAKSPMKNLNVIIIVRMTGQKKYKMIPNTEIHNFETFLSDTYDHDFAAVYEKLDPAKFSKQFDMKKVSDLPKFSSLDAAARYLGFREGDVIKIKTKSEISGLKIEYKYVN